MKRLTVLTMLLCGPLFAAGCGGQRVTADYHDAAQLVDAEANELARAYFWYDYVKSTFKPDAIYPLEGDNVQGIVPKTSEQAAEEVQKAADYVVKQRYRVERAKKARDALDR